MTPPRSDQGFVRMPDAEFEAMLARAAEKGAKRALAAPAPRAGHAGGAKRERADSREAEPELQ